MKTYIVYANGVEVGTVKAGSHNAAESKAMKKYGSTKNAHNPDGTILSTARTNISVAYTEV